MRLSIFPPLSHAHKHCLPLSTCLSLLVLLDVARHLPLTVRPVTYAAELSSGACAKGACPSPPAHDRHAQGYCRLAEHAFVVLRPPPHPLRRGCAAGRGAAVRARSLGPAARRVKDLGSECISRQTEKQTQRRHRQIDRNTHGQTHWTYRQRPFASLSIPSPSLLASDGLYFFLIL